MARDGFKLFAHTPPRGLFMLFRPSFVWELNICTQLSENVTSQPCLAVSGFESSGKLEAKKQAKSFVLHF